MDTVPPVPGVMTATGMEKWEESMKVARQFPLMSGDEPVTPLMRTVTVFPPTAAGGMPWSVEAMTVGLAAVWPLMAVGSSSGGAVTSQVSVCRWLRAGGAVGLSGLDEP